MTACGDVVDAVARLGYTEARKLVSVAAAAPPEGRVGAVWRWLGAAALLAAGPDGGGTDRRAAAVDLAGVLDGLGPAGRVQLAGWCVEWRDGAVACGREALAELWNALACAVDDAGRDPFAGAGGVAVIVDD